MPASVGRLCLQKDPVVGVGPRPGRRDHRGCSLPKHMSGWEFVFQTTCDAPNDWSVDAVPAQGDLRLCLEPGWVAKSGDALLALA